MLIISEKEQSDKWSQKNLSNFVADVTTSFRTGHMNWKPGNAILVDQEKIYSLLTHHGGRVRFRLAQNLGLDFLLSL